MLHIDGRFGGIWMHSREEKLQAYVKQKGLHLVSLPMFTGMHKPWDAVANSGSITVLPYIIVGVVPPDSPP